MSGRVDKLREERKKNGQQRREYYLTDFEHDEVKRFIKRLRHEQKKVRQGNGSTDDAAP